MRATLPIFLENAYEAKSDCVTVYGSDAVLESLRRDIFNDRTWPDFVALSEGAARRVKVVLTGECARIAAELGISRWHVSISHIETHATASAIGMRGE